MGALLRDKLLLAKPDVVLEHLKTEKAIPLTSNARIQRKLYSTVERYYDSVSGMGMGMGMGGGGAGSGACDGPPSHRRI